MLPTKLNLIPEGVSAQYSHRNAYIAMGLYDENNCGVDVGIVNQGNGWMPCYYDTIPCSDKKHYGGSYAECIADDSATNALIVVKPGSDLEHVHLFVQFLNSSGVAVNTFDRELQVVKRTNWNRYYRFASLVQSPDTTSDIRTDSTYMTGGRFTNLGIYNKGTGKYEPWGVNTSFIERFWIMHYPKCQVTYTTNSDSFSIDHWA